MKLYRKIFVKEKTNRYRTNEKQSLQAPKSKLYESYKSLIIEHINSKGFRPVTEDELFKRLNIVAHHSSIFNEVIQKLVEDGSILIEASHQWILPSHDREQNFVYGTLSLNPKGFGFVKIQRGESSLIGQEVFISKDNLYDALHQDEVCVLLTKQDHRGWEGSIVRVVSRSQSTLYGFLTQFYPTKQTWQVHVPIMPEHQFIATQSLIDPSELCPGSRVSLNLLKAGDRYKASELSIIENLGHIDCAQDDIPFAMQEYGIRHEFPENCMEETRALGKRVKQTQLAKRKDLRDLDTITIDPETAKDFDDAISIEKLENGSIRLWVHIADVPSYVTPSSHLDLEARKRGNSTYFPSHCVPMLPTELSDELCSLKPNVLRLAITTEIDFDSSGQIIGHKIYRSVIRSNRRLSYEEAMKMIETPNSSLASNMLEMMNTLYEKRLSLRLTRGALQLALPEAKIYCREDGNPDYIKLIDYDRSHQLIEEFMVTTNEVIAQHLCENNLPGIFRVHEAPDDKAYESFQDLVYSYGFDFKVQNNPKELQNFFKEIQDKPYYPQVCVAYIRCMKLAIYHEENRGHFGLALNHYCHFTSPIRRYSDLLTMRSVLGEEQSIDWSKEAMYLSETERRSGQAEQSVSSLKKWRLIKQKFEGNARSFYGIVGKVLPFGVTFNLRDFFLEIFIPISELAPIYLHYDETSHFLYSKKNSFQIHAGDEVLLEIKELDLIRKEGRWSIDQEWIGAKYPEISIGKKQRNARLGKENHSQRRSHSSYGSKSQTLRDRSQRTKKNSRNKSRAPSRRSRRKRS